MEPITLSQDVAAAASHYQKESRYWVEKFAGNPGKINFPIDFKNNDNSYNQGFLSFQFPNELFIKMMKIRNGSDSILFIVLTAGISVLLSKYTGCRDIIIAVPILKQNTDGDFVNTVVTLRNSLEGGSCFKELLAGIKQEVLTSFKNANYPLDALLYNLGIPISGNRNELFDTAILLENIQDIKYLNSIDFNMIFSFKRTDEHIEGKVEYNRNLYLQATVERIASHFVRLMQYALSNIDLKLSEIEFLSDDEKKQLLEDFNSTSAFFPAEKTIHELFEERVDMNPDAIAVVENTPRLTNNGYNTRVTRCLSITSRFLDSLSNGLAWILRKKGIMPGKIVTIMVSPETETITAILGIMKAGGTYLPIDPLYPGERISYLLKDSNTGIILTSKGLANEIEPWSEKIVIELDYKTDNNLNKEGAPRLTSLSLPQTPVYLIYTSGTSGKPKGAVLRNENLVNYVTWFFENSHLTGCDKTLLLSSLAFDLGYTALYSALLKGCELHLMDRDEYLSPGIVWGHIERHQISYLKLTPSLFTPLVEDHNFNIGTSRSLRLLVIGGEAIIPRDLEKAHSICPHLQVINHYGPTETTIGAIARFIDFSDFDEYKKNPSIGKPIHNTRVYILDKYRKLLPTGIPGELYISGYGVGDGYCNNPELTAISFTYGLNELKKINKSFVGGAGGRFYKKAPLLYRTGDLARWLPNGEIDFLGRTDHQVKIRGFRIEPGEIENCLLSYAGIRDVVIVKNTTGNNGDEYLCAYVVSDRKITSALLKEHLLKKLPEYMIPSYFVQVDKIPVTLNGKLDRRLLPEPEMEIQNDYIPAENELEKELVRIWSEVLNLKKETLGIHDNFFDLGGHSLKVTNLVSRIHKDLNVNIPMREIFKTPTIKGLASYIGSTEKNIFVSIKPVEKKEYYPISSAQKRMYLLQQLAPQSTAYNKIYLMQIEGNLDKNHLELIFKQLIVRHESLRTAYFLIGNVLHQKISEGIDINFKIEEYNPAEDGYMLSVDDRVRKFVRPFNLAKAPLMRVGLIETGSNEYVLMLDLHHITSDALSMEIIVRDIITLYRGETLPQLHIQYKDYSTWQDSEVQQKAIKKEELFWLNQLSGELPVLNLPLDYERPLLQSFNGATVSFEVSPEEIALIRALAKTMNVRLYSLIFAIFYVFLYKITGKEIIIIGTDIAGRVHEDLKNICGMFTNTLALINYPAGKKSFTNFLHEIETRTLEAFENQTYPFDELVEKLKINRDTSRNPIFDVLFSFQIIDKPTLRKVPAITDIQFKPFVYKNTTSKFDLNLSVLDTEKQLLFSFEYCTDLFKENTIQTFSKYFTRIISEVVTYPGKTLAELQIVDNEYNLKLIESLKEKKGKYLIARIPGDSKHDADLAAEFDL